MTPLHATLIALTVATAIAAWSLARRDPRNRPVAWYLSAIIVLDLLRWGRSVVLQPTTAPRVGWELVARHVEVGLYLASILALPALAVVVFGHEKSSPSHRPLCPPVRLRASAARSSRRQSAVRGAGQAHHGDMRRAGNERRPTQAARGERLHRPGPRAGEKALRLIALAWLLLTAGIVAGYPELRGDDLMTVYAAVEAVSVMVCLGCVVSWAWSGRAIAEAHSPAASSTLALIAGAAAVVLLDAVAVDWGGVVAANATMVACVLVVQLRALCQAPRRARP